MVKSVRGNHVNMEQIRNANAMQKAVGNLNMNARGDRLDQSGNIIMERSAMIADYNQRNPNAVRNVSLKDRITADILGAEAPTPAEAVRDLRTSKKKIIESDE